MRSYFIHAFGALTCLALSLILALVVATLVPVIHGPVQLEKDYSAYSHEEIREIFKKADKEANSDTSLLQFARGRAVLGQALIWIFGLIIFKPAKITQFVIWQGVLVSGWAIGIFDSIQVLVLGILIIISCCFVLWKQGRISPQGD